MSLYEAYRNKKLVLKLEQTQKRYNHYLDKSVVVRLTTGLKITGTLVSIAIDSLVLDNGITVLTNEIDQVRVSTARDESIVNPEDQNQRRD